MITNKRPEKNAYTLFGHVKMICEKQFHRILIVEDDIDTAEMLALVFTAHGYECLLAHEGGDALHKIEQHPPDLVLLDVCLPGDDGFNVCKRIRSDFSTDYIPIIMLTACDDLQSKVSGLEVGADDYITKPYDISELMARVKSLFRIKMLQEQLKTQNKNLNELNAFKDEFVSIFTHDLRNIIMPIREASLLLYQKPADDMTRKMAEIIHRQSDRIISLLKSLMRSMDQKSGLEPLTVIPVDLYSYFQGIIAEQQKQYCDTTIHFKRDVRCSLTNWTFDPFKIDDVLTELFLNLIRYTPHDGVITLIVDEYYKDNTRSLLIGVQNTGDGIPEANLEQYKSDQFSDDTLMNGLGLSRCITIIEQHCGRMWAESQPGFGSVFYFTIPENVTNNLSMHSVLNREQ